MYFPDIDNISELFVVFFKKMMLRLQTTEIIQVCIEFNVFRKERSVTDINIYMTAKK